MTDAVEHMEKELSAELNRLLSLAEVNPNVRADEVEQISARRELLGIHLRDTRVRLDAVRVIVNALIKLLTFYSDCTMKHSQ